MSGSLPADVILEPRLGPRTSKNRGRTTVGSVQAVYFDVRDRNTNALVGGATGVAGFYWLPGTIGQDSEAQPLDLVEIAPGTWLGWVPVDLPGTFTVWVSIETPSRQTAEIVFDATSLGNIPVSTGTPTYAAVQAVAGAAGASAAMWVDRKYKPITDDLAARVAAQEALTSYVEPAITAMTASPSVLEVGASAASVTLTVLRNRMDLPVNISGSSTVTIPAGETSVVLQGPFTADAAWAATVTDPSPPPGQPATAAAGASLSFRHKRYWGVSASATPDDAAILAMASEFATASSPRQVATLSPANQFVVYAQPADWPIAASVGFGVVATTAFTDTIRDLVNASGATASYRIHVLTYRLDITEEFTF
jgi:hypothetical protein